MKLQELQAPMEVQELENQLDKLMRPVGLDVSFTRHFIERILGREKPVTIEEVVSSFEKLKRRYKKRLLRAKRTTEYEAVLKDLSNDLNVVFAIHGDELVNITIKRKGDFRLNRKGGEELRV